MIRRRRSTLSAGLLAGLLALVMAAGGACDSSKPAPRTYVGIDVTLDRDSIVDQDRQRIDICHLLVSGDEKRTYGLPCARGRVPYDYGPIEYASDIPAGTLTFTVTMKSITIPIGEGTSPPVDIVPGASLRTTIKVVDVTRPDAGADGGGVPDGGADGASGG